MKLLIVLSVIACGYAAKLDRTYLPPANAGTSGGSPGFLNTPLGPSGFGQPAGFGQAGANGGFNGAAGKPAFGGQQSGSNGFGVPSNQYGQPGPVASASGQSGFAAPAQTFGNQAQDYQRSQPQRAQASAEQSAEILRSDNQNDGTAYSYSFETSNGISAEESGVATNGVQAQGAFAYSDDDGQQFRVQYTADENGYHPEGDHLPTSPPIPDEILKSIEENARAAASGTQEGAYNPDEDNSDDSAQQYNNNAPTSYNQAPTGQNGFNQAGKSQVYGAPNAGPRPQSGSQGHSQGHSQQYNAGYGAPNAGSARPSNGFGQPQTKSPSQAYGSPMNDANEAASSLGQQVSSQQYSQQGPSQQYSSRPSGASNFAPSGPQAKPQQYQASPSGQFPSAGRPQGAQAQDASGYQYNKPQSGFGGNTNNGLAQQYRSQNGVPSGSQGFSRPSGNNAFPSSSSSGQGSYGSAPSSNPQGSFAPSGSNGPSGPKGTFDSNGQASFVSSARPKSAFSPSTGSQSSFASSNGFPRPQAPGSNGQGFSRPQGQALGAKSSMSDAGYEYNRPSGNTQFGASPQNGNSPFGGQPQNGFKSADQGRPSQFGAPRAPPSFSEEEGYKY